VKPHIPAICPNDLDTYGATVHTEFAWGIVMNFDRFPHKGLKRLSEDGSARGVPANLADKLRYILFAMETAESIEKVGRFPGWKLHPLKGDLKGFWSLTITGNWRLIFRYDPETNTATDIDLIDYH